MMVLGGAGKLMLELSQSNNESYKVSRILRACNVESGVIGI